MNSFFKGMLLGVGVGLLTAPMRGEEMRKLLSERMGELRGYLPENEQLSLYTQQVSDRVSQTASNLMDYAQQAATTMKGSTSNLSGIAQNAATEVKETSQDVANTTRQTVPSGKSSSRISTPTTPTTPTPTTFPPTSSDYSNLERKTNY